MLRFVAALLCSGMAGAVEARESDAFQQSERFISQLTIADGGVAWFGLQPGTRLADAELRWRKKLVLVPRNGEERTAAVTKDGVDARLAFEREGGALILTDVCADLDGRLGRTEIARLKEMALRRFPSLQRPERDAPADEPLWTEAGELVVSEEHTCIRMGAAL